MEAKIKINKPILLDFFKSIFKEENGFFIITSTHDLGKFLISRVSMSNFPVRKFEGINIRLPITSYSTGRKKYLYYTSEDIEKINYYIDALFSIDFDRYYLQGQKLGFQQKDIIESYINFRNLVSLNCDTEMLKKRTYRSSLKNQEKISKYLENRAYHRAKIIQESLNINVVN